MKRKVLLCLLIICVSSPFAKAQQNEEYTCTSPHEVSTIPSAPIDGTPKNIILLIGDGMSLQHGQQIEVNST